MWKLHNKVNLKSRDNNNCNQISKHLHYTITNLIVALFLK